MAVLEGIQPSMRSSFDGWLLPGHQKALDWCSEWRLRGCLRSDLHVHDPDCRTAHMTLDGLAYEGLDEIEVFKCSCGRLSCPICYKKACLKHALKIEHRMRAFKIKGRNLKAIHVVVSPPKEVWQRFDMNALYRMAYRIAERCGVYGGSIIPHPWRKAGEDDLLDENPVKVSGVWAESPHFHIIAYGWVHRSKENYAESGWIVKNLGVRRSIAATASYQLSHCGVHPKHHSVRWFGALAYNKMRCSPLPRQSHPCPSCGLEMYPVKTVLAEHLPLIISLMQSSLNEGDFFHVEHGVFAENRWCSNVFEGG